MNRIIIGTSTKVTEEIADINPTIMVKLLQIHRILLNIKKYIDFPFIHKRFKIIPKNPSQTLEFVNCIQVPHVKNS